MRHVYYHLGGTFSELCALLTAVLQIGNTIGKAVIKRKDVAVGQALVRMAERRGIRRKAELKTTLTLARLSISFFPLMYVIAQRLDNDHLLHDKVACRSPRPLQGLCYMGALDIPRFRDAEDFIRVFSLVLARSKNKEYSAEKSNEEVNKFILISKNGLAKDEALLALATHADLSPQQCHGFFMEELASPRPAGMPAVPAAGIVIAQAVGNAALP